MSCGQTDPPQRVENPFLRKFSDMMQIFLDEHIQTQAGGLVTAVGTDRQ